MAENPARAAIQADEALAAQLQQEEDQRAQPQENRPRNGLSQQIGKHRPSSWPRPPTASENGS